MTEMRQNMKKDVTKKFNITFIVTVAESLIKVSQSYGDAIVLAEAVGCTEKFASKVLCSVASGRASSLFGKEKRLNTRKWRFC